MLDQIEEQVEKTAKQKLNAYRDNLISQFECITPWRKEHRTVLGNMGGQEKIFEWSVDTFFLVHENIDPVGYSAMRGDEDESLEAWYAWRFIYNLLKRFIEGLPEDAKIQRKTFNAMPVGQALINIILLSTYRSCSAYKSKEDLYSGSISQESGARSLGAGTYLLARGDQHRGCSLLGQGYLEEDLLHLFKDRTIKDMIRSVPSEKEQAITISGSNLQVHE